MKLSLRLEKILELCSKVSTIADIGCDHGFVASQLIERSKADHVIAGDINKMPLEKAKIHAVLRNTSDSIDFRLGSGFKILKPNEAKAAIIAGMGGNLMAELLDESEDIIRHMEYIILQPAQNVDILRRYIYSGKFTILKEDLVKEEDGRFYEYLKVRFNEEVLGFSDKERDFDLSPVLINHKHPLLYEYIFSKMKEIALIKSKLDLNYETSRVRLKELNKKENYYEEVLKWL